MSKKTNPVKEKEVAYDFAHGRRCPRCGTLDTEARSTQGDIQYRRCKRGVCRHAYSVVGRPI